MSDLFYLTRTQINNIYKFGMSVKDDDSRLTRGYSGLNIPSKIFINKRVSDGLMEEHYFKEFLNIRKIPIVYGNEFFKFDGSIEILIIDYNRMPKTRYRTKKRRITEENVKNQIVRSNKQRRLTLADDKVFRCNMCNYETKVKGNLKHHHNKRIKHLDNVKKDIEAKQNVFHLWWIIKEHSSDEDDK